MAALAERRRQCRGFYGPSRAIFLQIAAVMIQVAHTQTSSSTFPSLVPLYEISIIVNRQLRRRPHRPGFAQRRVYGLAQLPSVLRQRGKGRERPRTWGKGPELRAPPRSLSLRSYLHWAGGKNGIGGHATGSRVGVMLPAVWTTSKRLPIDRYVVPPKQKLGTTNIPQWLSIWYDRYPRRLTHMAKTTTRCPFLPAGDLVETGFVPERTTTVLQAS